MTDEDSTSESHLALWIAAAAVILPILYVLSIGPVLAVAQKAGVNLGVLEGFYTPVIWLHNHTPLEKPLEEYVKWWGVAP